MTQAKKTVTKRKGRAMNEAKLGILIQRLKRQVEAYRAAAYGDDVKVIDRWASRAEQTAKAIEALLPKEEV